MSRTYNIEVVYERKRPRAAVIAAVCALVLAACCATVSVTLAQAAEQAASQQILALSNSTDKISLTEEWNAADGLNLHAGSTVQKRPIVRNNDANCALSVYLQVKDGKTGRVLDPNNAEDKRRLELILGTVWADPNACMQNGTPYSEAALAALASRGVNNLYNAAQFGAGVWDATAKASDADAVAGAYAFAYTGTGAVFANGAQAVLFDHIAVPTGYTAEDLALMGDFSLVVWAKAVYDEAPEPDPDPSPDPDPDPAPTPDPGNGGNNNAGKDTNANGSNGGLGSLAQTGDIAQMLLVAAGAFALVGATLLVIAARKNHTQGGERHE